MPAVLPLIPALIGVGIGTTTSIIIGAVVSVGLSLFLSSSQTGVSKSYPTSAGSSYTTDPTKLTFSSDAPRRMVYGKTRISGVVTYANVSGDGYQYLWLVVVIAEHAIESVDAIYFNNDLASDVADGYFEWWYYDGTQTSVDPQLHSEFSEYTDDCILKGCSYAVVKLKYDKEIYSSGQPNITFDVKGKKLFDPRDNTTRWCNNAALALADFMTSSNGLGALSTEIDWDLVKEAANISDQIPGSLSANLCDGRYTIDGVVELSTKNGDVISQMLSSCAGTVVFSEGKYRIYVGASRPVVSREITIDDLRGNPSLQPRTPTDQSFNAVKGTFIDATNNWQLTDFPPVIGEEYVAQDGNVIQYKDLQLNFTISPITAQRLATIFLRRNRLEKTIILPCKWSCFNYEVWDVVTLVFPALGWISKQFQITSWVLNPPTNEDAGGIDLTLKEYSDDIYSDDIDIKAITGGGTVIIPDVTKPNPVTSFVATSDSTTVANSKPRIKLDWTISNDIYCVGYEIAIGLYPFMPGESDYQFISGRKTIQIYISDNVISGNTYVAYIRVVNSYENRSSSFESNKVTATGLPTQYPDPLGGLAIAVDGDYVVLSWATPPDGVKSTAIFWAETDNSLDNAILVCSSNFPQNSVRLLRELKDGYYFATFMSDSGLFGDYSSSFCEKRISNKYNETLTLKRHLTDVKNAVWLNNHSLVVKSQNLAKDDGWNTFDEMVPNPFQSIELWSKTGTSLPAGNLRISGNVGIRRSPVSKGVIGPINSYSYVTYDDTEEYVTNIETISQDFASKLGFLFNNVEAYGNYVTSLIASLEYLTTFISDATIVRNGWGDIRFDWNVVNAIENDVYTVSVLNFNDNSILWSIQTTDLFSYFSVADSVPLFSFPPTYLKINIVSNYAKNKVVETSVPIDNSFVKYVIVFAGQSNAYAHFSELSGENARHDKVSAFTCREKYAELKNVPPSEVYPLNASLGSSAADKLADDKVATTPDNYWYDLDGDTDGPRLTEFVTLVSPLTEKVVGIVWSQGENDASAHDAELPFYSTTTRFEDALNKIFDRFRDIVPASQCDIVIQILARSYWNGVEAAGVTWQEYRNVEREVVVDRTDTILGSWADGAERFSGYVEEASNAGAIHYIESVYQTAAPKLAQSVFDKTDLISYPPTWVDMAVITEITAVKQANYDILISWNAGLYSNYHIINTSIATGLPLASEYIDTNSYTFTSADQIAAYGFNAGYVSITITGYDATDDVESPSATLVTAV